MSLNKRKDTKTVRIEMQASRGEYEALADVLEKFGERINVDLYPNKQDVPGRITLNTTEREGPTVIQYPRMTKLLHDMAEALREEGSSTVALGTLNLEDFDIIEKSTTLKLMNQVTRGETWSKTTFTAGKEKTVEELDALIAHDAGPQGIAGVGMLTKTDPLWVYAESLISHDGTPIDIKELMKPEQLEKLKFYPPDINNGMIDKWLKREGNNRAYLVIVRTKESFPWDVPIYTFPGQWDKWLKTRPTPGAMTKYENLPPKTYGDLFERMVVYATARTFDLKGAFIAPVRPDTLKKGWSPVGNIKEKVLEANAVSAKGASGIPRYINYNAFVVVGKGPFKSTDMVREKRESEFTIPEVD